MKIRNIIKLMIKSIYNKKIVILLLLAMSTISIYMIDVISTKYFSNKYYIHSMSSMFAINPEKVNYVKNLDLMDPDYTPETGDEMIDFIRKHEGVTSCGRFSHNKSSINGELFYTLVIEKDIVDIGNLLLDNNELNHITNSEINYVYVGYALKNQFEIGESFYYSPNDSDTLCEVAGYLKKGASWPLNGDYFSMITDSDTFTLDNKIVVLTDEYQYFINSGGMPDFPYYVTDGSVENELINHDIINWASQHNLGVNVINEEELIDKEKKENGLLQDTSFNACVLLFVLSLISMSAAAIVSCLLNRQQMGIMVACGVSKVCITVIIILENIMVVLLPEIFIWIIRQHEIFGKIIVCDTLDMMRYSYWVGHSIFVPIIYLIELLFVSFIASIVPALIIRKMNVSDAIKPGE